MRSVASLSAASTRFFRVESDVLGFFPGGRLGGDGGLGKATGLRYLGFGFGPDAFGLGKGFLGHLVGLGAFLVQLLPGGPRRGEVLGVRVHADRGDAVTGQGVSGPAHPRPPAAGFARRVEAHRHGEACCSSQSFNATPPWAR